MKINILGHRYDVVYKQGDKMEVPSLGRCLMGRNKILIDTTQTKTMQGSALLHEIIEALNFHLKLNLTEEQVHQLEAGLFQVLKENKLYGLPKKII